jgi:hypothetical protein
MTARPPWHAADPRMLATTLAAVALGLLLLVTQAQGTVWFVQQAGGSDNNAGTTASPWATINKCATSASAGDTCTVRAGTYRETVIPSANNVTFQPEGTDVVTVSGADVVTGWSVHTGNIFKSNSLALPLGLNNQVFVDGAMMNLARWPNASLDVSHPTFAQAQSSLPDSNEDCTGTWVINDSALTFASGFWNGAEVTHLAAGMWSGSGTVTSSSNGQIQFTTNNGSQSRCMESPRGQQYPYYLSNKLAALDTAGEWYYDGGITTLYLWTPAGDNPSGHTVEAKRRTFAFDLKNRSNITIKNLRLFAASVDMNASSSNNVLDGITATYVWHQLQNVPAAGIGQVDSKWGAWQTGIRLSGSQNVLKNCTIAFSSANGVYLHGTQQTVDNCTIHDVAYLKVEGGAVSWMGADPSGSNPGCTGPVVSNNTLYNSGRHLVNFYYCPNLTITHNLFYNACIQVGDCGFIYTSKGGTSGTISYNIGHDNQADYWVFGLYLDADPQNYTLHHNVIYNVSGAIGINIGEPAVNINVYNNTVWNVATNLGIVNAGSLTNTRIWNNLVQSGLPNGGDQSMNLETNSPGFVNAGAGNFQLTAGSPARNAGRVISGITDGYAESAPDIGAYEFGVPAWTAGSTVGCTGACGTPGCPACTGCGGGCGTPGCPACPSTTPIAWWKFDEGTGTSAADATGNGHTATLVNGVSWTAPRLGTNAVAFDGVDDTVTLPDPILASFSADHTVCLWAQTTAPTAIGSGGFKQTPLNIATDAANGLRWVIVENSTPPGTWHVTTMNGDTPTVRTTTGATFPANAWVHLCATQIVGGLTLYVNGVAPAQGSSPDHYAPEATTVLGGRSTSTGTLAGKLDEVKIWNRGLSAAEVATEFGGTSRTPRHRVLPH